MKTRAVTPADLLRSIVAAPPFARNGDLTLNRAGNAAMSRRLERGGLSTLFNGGNPNPYHIGRQ